VNAIVTRVGYRDVSSFGRLFRKRTSLTPREYRERFQR
jgi:YesN/AraC family two-component response regulator